LDFTPFLQTILGAVAGGIGAYVGIRERLARVEEKAHAVRSTLTDVVNTINRAHERIDEVLHAQASSANALPATIRTQRK
jgi:hypothetical protein